MRTKNLIKQALVSSLIMVMIEAHAQIEETQTERTETQSDTRVKKLYNPRFGESIRGSNAVTVAGGTSVMNGDLPDPLFEVYFHAGYKRFLGSYVNLNLTYHKFNLAYEDAFNEGFMSFDLNIEANLMPYNSFSPFVYAGGGLHAANYFETTHTKVQGGGGIEYLVLPQLGIKLFADYNHIFDDELDGREFGAADDIYWRMAFGLNWYFGRFDRSNKLSSDVPTVIESNPIVDDY